MMREIRSELTRLTRPRLLGIWAALTAIFAGLINSVMFQVVKNSGFTPPNGPGVTFPTMAQLQSSHGLTAGLGAAASLFGVLTLAIWATATASDYSTGLIRILVSAQPHRWRLLAGKAIALAAVTAAMAAVAVAVNTAAAPQAAHAAGITVTAWKAGALKTVAEGWVNLYLAMLVWGLIGVALAVITRSAAAAISTGVGWVLLVEGVIKSAAKSIGHWLPGTTLSSLANSGSTAQPYHTAIILGVAYAVTCWLAAWQVFKRREVTE